jgi:oligopeptide/dipeptide ABC transporter ATP-binding protein
LSNHGQLGEHPLSMTTLLDVRDLEVDYLRPKELEIAALRGVSFTLNSGETLGVIGESGSGKSTLALSLLCLLPENAKILNGNVYFNGEDLLQMDPTHMRELRGERIALIFQEPSAALHPTMQIRDQVGEILGAHFSLRRKERKERVSKILAEVFGSEANRISCSYPHQLSGGQRQRAVIAQAISCEPSVIVADEPTASLDTVTQQEILSLFQKLKDELGVAIIFITHNPALLSSLADRILVLYAGKVVEIGKTKDVLRSPLHPYSRLLLECSPPLNGNRENSVDPKLPVIPGEAPEPSKCAQGCVFAPRCPERVEICVHSAPARTSNADGHEVSCFLHEG